MIVAVNEIKTRINLAIRSMESILYTYFKLPIIIYRCKIRHYPSVALTTIMVSTTIFEDYDKNLKFMANFAV